MKLNYKSFGEGEAVIILHGLFGMLDNWQGFSSRLAESYRVIVPDQRNHGKSFHHPRFNYELLAEDLFEMIAYLKLDKIHLVGHSMGGKVAMSFGSKYSELLSSLTIIDISCRSYPPSHTDIFKAILNTNFQDKSSRREIEIDLFDKINDIAVVQFLMKNLGRNDENRFEWKANFSVLYKSYSAILSEVETGIHSDLPVLLIKGKHSNYLTPIDVSEMQSRYTNLKFDEIDAGHWVHADNPEALLISLKSHFSSFPTHKS